MAKYLQPALQLVKLAACVVMIGAATARASLVETVSASVAAIPLTPPASGNTGVDLALIDVDLQPFDSNLGALLSARFIPEVSVRASGFGSGGSLSFTVGGDFLVDGVSVGSVSRSGNSSVTPPLSPRSTAVLTGDIDFDVTDASADATVVSALTGSSPFDFQLVGDQVFSRWPSNGELEVTGGSVMVEYTYAAVIPEPNLSGIVGLLGVFVTNLRRKRRR